jgi:fructose/tagatose bisphosphate aldolase
LRCGIEIGEEEGGNTLIKVGGAKSNDPGDTFERCKSCIEHRFNPVMIDSSHFSIHDNVVFPMKDIDFANSLLDYVMVEDELGILVGVNGDVHAEHHTYTHPEMTDCPNRTY